MREIVDCLIVYQLGWSRLIFTRPLVRLAVHVLYDPTLEGYITPVWRTRRIRILPCVLKESTPNIITGFARLPATNTPIRLIRSNTTFLRFRFQCSKLHRWVARCATIIKFLRIQFPTIIDRLQQSSSIPHFDRESWNAYPRTVTKGPRYA